MESSENDQPLEEEADLEDAGYDDCDSDRVCEPPVGAGSEDALPPEDDPGPEDEVPPDEDDWPTEADDLEALSAWDQ